MAVRYPDGLLILDGEPFHEMSEVPTRNATSFLAILALGAPPMTGAAVGRLLDSFGFTPADVGISDDFVRQLAHLIKPGTSVLFVLDEVGDLDAILRSIRGLGGTVLKTSVDVERARLHSVHTGGAQRMTPETNSRRKVLSPSARIPWRSYSLAFIKC